MTPPSPTSTEHAALAARLRTRRAELRAEVRAQFADHDDPRVMALRNRLEDTDDWAVADEMAALDIAQVSRDVKELAEVEAALERIADGSYGLCIDCGAEIARARLDANPAARRCIRCQEALERRTAPRAAT